MKRRAFPPSLLPASEADSPIIKTMLEEKDVCVRRLREGYEFFKSLRQRKADLAAAQVAAV